MPALLVVAVAVVVVVVVGLAPLESWQHFEVAVVVAVLVCPLVDLLTAVPELLQPLVAADPAARKPPRLLLS
jgi:hypothetical protein